jgi:hypothetical protein
MTDLPQGLYEQLITRSLDTVLQGLEVKIALREALDPADAHEVLTRHIAVLTRRVLAAAAGDDRSSVAAQLELANRIARAIVDVAPDVTAIDNLVAESGDLLSAVAHREALPTERVFPPRPDTPLSTTALLVNGRDQPRIGSEIKLELESADRVDLLCAFVKWHGVRIVEDHVARLVRRGGRIRVITTTYMGAGSYFHRRVHRLARDGVAV